MARQQPLRVQLERILHILHDDLEMPLSLPLLQPDLQPLPDPLRRFQLLERGCLHLRPLRELQVLPVRRVQPQRVHRLRQLSQLLVGVGEVRVHAQTFCG